MASLPPLLSVDVTLDKEEPRESALLILAEIRPEWKGEDVDVVSTFGILVFTANQIKLVN